MNFPELNMVSIYRKLCCTPVCEPAVDVDALKTRWRLEASADDHRNELQLGFLRVLNGHPNRG